MSNAKRPNIRFKPNVTVGDLLLLAHLSDLHNRQGFANPGGALREKNPEISADRIRDSMLRIRENVGEVEKIGNGRRSQQPTIAGGNIGAAGVLADLIIRVALDGTTDQLKLRAELERAFISLTAKYANGDLKSVANTYSTATSNSN